ncbi:MAG: phage head closure protein [Hyphomicrobium sp.]|jgi:SPP1 family predicted phage head-tail adaptor
MTIIPIGELSHRFALQSPVLTPDGGGGETTTWSLAAEIWGALRPYSGGEQFEADGLSGRISHELWIRHRQGVTLDMRFVLGSRIFEMRSVLDVGERRRFLRCLVEERLP